MSLNLANFRINLGVYVREYVLFQVYCQPFTISASLMFAMNKFLNQD